MAGQDQSDDGGSTAVETRDDTFVDADAAVVNDVPPPSRGAGLSRAKIVGTAIEFIDEHGLAGLTMRKLGQRLGVEAMSMYRYVPGREALLDAVVSEILEGLQADEDVIEKPTHGWQDFLQRLAHGIRRVALAHPQAFPLVASRPVEAPWLRPPLRSLAWVEAFLDALIAEGFDDEGAVGAYRAFSSFLLGHLLLEVAIHGADVGPLDTIEEEQPRRPLSDYPNVSRLQDMLADDQAAIEFEDALEELMRRLELIRNDPSQ